MTIDNQVRVIAGSFILLSLLLAYLFSPYWLWLTALIGVNLVQSGFTNFCLTEIILKKMQNKA